MLRVPLFATLLVGVLLSLLLSACATPREAGPGDPTAEPDVTPEALAAARARWEAAGLEDYRVTFSNSCFCPEDVRGPFALTVRDGAVQEALFGGRAVAVDPQRHYTVEAVFDRIEAALDRDADAVRAAFDGALGFPTSVYIDYEAMAADEEDRFELRDLAPLGG